MLELSLIQDRKKTHIMIRKRKCRLRFAKELVNHQLIREWEEPVEQHQEFVLECTLKRHIIRWIMIKNLRL